jgi:Tol biopolymer transport system component
MKTPHWTAATLFVAAFSCSAPPAGSRAPLPVPSSARTLAAEAGERHLTNLRQLTNGGENAEAYFSRDGAWITFQSTREGRTCDQQYIMRVDGSNVQRVSNGLGKTTCGWFFPDSKRLFFASSQAHDSTCPPRPDPSAGYVWPLDRYDIYSVSRNGTDVRRITNYNVYTAEGVLSPDGRTIVFTSLKDGDLEIYTMNVDGTNVHRLTHTPGYDGGPWWSPDGKRIAYRAHHPADSAQLADYRALLSRNMVRPSRVELFVMDADGSNQRQVTSLGGANFGPSWTPDGAKIIFASNFRNPRGGNFDLFLIDAGATLAGADKVEQITSSPVFDGFPMFSPDGTKLLWASNRHDTNPTETNLIIADWKP